MIYNDKISVMSGLAKAYGVLLSKFLCQRDFHSNVLILGKPSKKTSFYNYQEKHAIQNHIAWQLLTDTCQTTRLVTNDSKGINSRTEKIDY